MTTFNTDNKTPYDMIIEILEKTNDGNDLSPLHLKLVELTANDFLSEAGEIALYELYANVKKGYVKPWFLGVEHMTQDHEGFVYWKGIQVEHYSHMDDKQALESLKGKVKKFGDGGAHIPFSADYIGYEVAVVPIRRIENGNWN